MKRKWIKAVALPILFLVALFAGLLLTGRGKETQEEMKPSLPGISFYVAGRPVNALTGYTEEMEIPFMRDTITPVEDSGRLEMEVRRNGHTLTQIRCEVYSLDGKTIYFKGEAEDGEEGRAVFQLNGAIPEEVSEAVLRVTVEMQKDSDVVPVYYYTRIKRQEELSIRECLGFAEQFHSDTFSEDRSEEILQYLEPGEQSDNTTFQTVDIHSDVSHIQWGGLQPQIVSDIAWSIKESNSVYSSILANYRVICKNEQDLVETYNVHEFFRVRINEGETYLLDYNRTMNQIFDGLASSLDEKGIILGLTDEAVPYKSNADGTLLAFVQERELWSYDQEKNLFVLIFSLADGEKEDVWSGNDEYTVRILRVDDGGVTFAVYGYIDRGIYEGRVGADIYYYDREKGTAEEKAFIPSTKSYAVTEEELGKLIYYHQGRQVLYLLSGGALYQVDMAEAEEERTVLAEQLEDGSYVVSGDGSLVACQMEGGVDTAQQVKVFDLENGGSYQVEAAGGDAVKPLGFINHDLICGYMKPTDKGSTAAGEELLPMYKLEIRNGGEGVLKTYMRDGLYISDVKTEENLITLNCVRKGETGYVAGGEDYITNNEEHAQEQVVLESFSTEEKEKQMRFTFLGESSSQALRTRRAVLVMPAVPTTVSFEDTVEEETYYVYGRGEPAKIYHKAADAVRRADEISGVVVSASQSYVWEKGNRDLAYDTGAQAFGRAEGQSSAEACTARMEQEQASRTDMTGCTLEQILYVLGLGEPVITMISPDHAVLLSGYSMTDISYIDPDDGALHTVSVNEMKGWTEAAGNIFIAYLK